MCRTIFTNDLNQDEHIIDANDLSDGVCRGLAVDEPRTDQRDADGYGWGYLYGNGACGITLLPLNIRGGEISQISLELPLLQPSQAFKFGGVVG